MTKIRSDTKIAGDFTVDNWKGLRSRLLEVDFDNPVAWTKAFNVFLKRIETRFLNPINTILSIRRFEGEGFSASALQCILVEFLEAFYQGKTYTPPRTEEEIQRRANRLGISAETLEAHLQPNEYNSSARLFRDFLTGHEPFLREFTPAIANNFYSSVRCGLLHEAATKGATVIRNRNGKSLIQVQAGADLIVYRTNFQSALESFIQAYKEELIASQERKQAFIRKMDDICQLRRIHYFAYGSNMAQIQLKNREVFVHNKERGYIRNYQFKYNKKSKDGSSKANIASLVDALTYGVCFEIDEDGYSTLKTFEKGYDEIEIPCFTIDGRMIISKAFISSSISSAAPTQEYMLSVVEGARENKLPDEYIERILTVAI